MLFRSVKFMPLLSYKHTCCYDFFSVDYVVGTNVYVEDFEKKSACCLLSKQNRIILPV